MKPTQSTEARSIVLKDEDDSLQAILQRTGKTTLRRYSFDELLARAPDDWQSNEANVDEFLASIRGH